jgi:beta-glucosidase
MEEKDKDKDKGDALLDEPEMSESEILKARLKFFFLLVGVLLILIIISIILLIALDKDLPPPKMENLNNWNDSYRKAEEFVSKLNRTEKVGLLYGVENMRFLNIKDKTELDGLCVGEIPPIKKNNKTIFKGMCLQDGPAGVRFADGHSISWQSNLNLAATFNRTLMYEVGKTQGLENKEKGINTFLSPCVNIMRNPQAGRVWEAFGEDPFYSGVCATEMIRGIQDVGVIATIKHFVGNDQETYRHASSSNIDMGPLMDIYVEPFYRPIHEARVGAVMSAYSAVNNTYASENKALLTDILRGILGFRGFVMSDWWAIYNNHSDNFNSGLDMNMPGGKYFGKYYGREQSFWSCLEEYEDEDIINKTRINESATRIIATMYQMNQMDKYPDVHLFKETKTPERIKLQRDAATESQVLLKNEDNILPLNNIKSIAVIGNAAQKRDCGEDGDLLCQNNTNRVQNGHIHLGYGSGTTTFNYTVAPIEGIKELAKARGIEVKESGRLIYDDDEDGVHIGATENIDLGVEAAKDCDVAIVFAKADSGEEYGYVENTIGDRPDLDLWHGADELIKKVAQVNKNVIVVIDAPAVVNVPWLNKVKAVIFSGFAGAESGHAIADVLFGVVNPSGHLPFTWAEIDDYCTKIENIANQTILPNGKTYAAEYRYEGVDSAGKKDDRPGYDMEQYNYTEGLYVGQRWFNKHHIKPIFPFGFGLTYTTFGYNNFKISMKEEGLFAEFDVKNEGNVTGSAVPMMFLTFPENIGDYPKYIFKGFEKIKLKPGEIKNVVIRADPHALSYFDVKQNRYVRVTNGKIKIYIGENGDPQQAKLMAEVDSKFVPNPVRRYY